ncbi:histidine phosphatase family protein, partial [bacterium]|nr:histidine phosphatase family protein [bacterium]
LVLLRHAIAEDLNQVPVGADTVPTDFERRLTLEGRAKLRRVVRHFARCMPAPDVLFSSPLVRARQTAAVAGRILDVPVQLCDELRPGGQAYGWLRGLSEEHLMLVGHEPDLACLAAQFLGLDSPVFSLKKSGLACLEGVPGHGQLGWLLTPRWLID